ncbi:recombinase family protein [Amycolatopsis sp. NPDC059021]|uniref:recombinase family protein n=1 Tax=Amycolatopsis sp. NPDC059021 TaxID=3346704 RepID=UPI00366D5EEC
MTAIAQRERRLRACLYLRISDLTDTTTSIPRQEIKCTARAELIGATDIVVRKDEDKSGYHAHVVRPGFDQALADLRARRVDVLIVFKVDRATRQGIPQASEIIRVVYETGCRFISIADGIDSENIGWELQLSFAAHQAREESRSTSTRVGDLRVYERDNGRWLGARPCGSLVTDDRKLVKHPVEAPMLREAVDRLFAGQSGQRVITWMNDQKFDSPRWATRKERIARLEAKGEPLKAAKLRAKPIDSVNRWAWQTLRKIITSPTLAGYMPYEDQIYRHSETGKPVRVGEGIVSLEEHARLVELFGPNGSRRRKTNPGTTWAEQGRTSRSWTHKRRDAKYLLADFARCGECGAKMMYEPFRKKGQWKARYRCVLGESGGRRVRQCPGNSMAAPGLETLVQQAVLTRLAALSPDDPSAVAMAERWADLKHPNRAARRAELEAAIAEEERFLETLEDEKLKGLFGGRRGEDRFKRRYEQSNARLDELEQELASIPNGALDVSFLELADEMQAAWVGSSLVSKREMLTLVLEHVWVRKPPTRGVRPSLDRLGFWWVGEPKPADSPHTPRSVAEAAAAA